MRDSIMETSIKENIKKEKPTGKEYFIGIMERCMMGSGYRE